MHPPETCSLPFSLLQQPASSIRTRASQAAVDLAELIFGLKTCNKLYRQVNHDGTMANFVAQALKTLDVRFHVEPQDMMRIPASGPCILVANHPYGGLEGLILFDLISRIRTDFKVIGNRLLGRLPALRSHLIAVDPFGTDRSTRINIAPLRQALKCLEQGELLIIFPAGEVSSRQSKASGVVDPVWSDSVARIVRRSKAPVVPVYFPGHNGPLFQWAGKIHPRLRTALLPRMLLEQRHQHKQIVIGQVISSRSYCELRSNRELTNYLRLRTYALATRLHTNTPLAGARGSRCQSMIPPIDKNQLTLELEQLAETQTLTENDEFRVCYASAGQIPWILNEIGRLREVTFREVGEGTGKACDLDRFDESYVHLFLWHKERQEVAGAYRLGHIDRILNQSGRKGLYTCSLFSMKPALLEELHAGLELGRSFVRLEYQRSFAPLLLLWKGIGHYLTIFPRYRYLFGPVSISRDYSSAAKQLITQVLTDQYRLNELAALVNPRTPLTFKPKLLAGLELKQQAFLKDIDHLSVLVSDMEADGKGVPVLLRHYLNLGGQILAFNRDPDFSDVIDGLLLVDLLKADKKQLQRYMGKEGYAGYMAYHDEARQDCA
ncbi:lysophospholipid acyltransferase family protein [Pelovirga terrestris]|uniref:Lysophospholipid acyltransferase family protein n=1 Tax=Pelovirga terrestris TaxID=2771352 RepID=A0A8J6R558_9BACT|nr:lysophospholipid acyltransferase family protein [Pelovirga terrestris]MBD1399909.1 lysophospholipid acyltransferase family protein [Pelovirga terrestris]